ncbi:MAG: hypothetical protein ACK5HY_09935, partial [Parahaliea sp.]
ALTGSRVDVVSRIRSSELHRQYTPVTPDSAGNNAIGLAPASPAKQDEREPVAASPAASLED